MQATMELFSSAPLEYELGPDVLYVPVQDGSARLLNMAGDFCSIPPVGAELLSAALGRGREEAVREISGSYGADPDAVRSDLDAFLAELSGMRLIAPRKAKRADRTARVGTPLWLRGGLRLARRLPAPGARAWSLLALARLSYLLLGWTRTVAAWRALHPVSGRPADDGEAEAVIHAIDGAIRQSAAGHPLQVECKERALCCWALAREAGLDACMVVGVQLFPLEAHCWCEYAGRTFSDKQDKCEVFQPVVRYGGEEENAR
ncbi:MAG TPA: lasso peptide biosynthesis B2 protein [Armatimonadota bacterium]|nr:lasso peptide biosynthesis B2 protein [Armatimonadota bacterium]